MNNDLKAAADIACIDARRAWLDIEHETIIRAAANIRGAIFWVQIVAALLIGAWACDLLRDIAP